VNEDTSNDAKLWKVGIAGGYWVVMTSGRIPQEIADGYFQNVITTTESMGRHDGYFSKFSLILRNRDRKFVTQIK
jgi:hypothetical protein